MELLPDVVIAGKLRLLRPLGHGGMGVVWAARHLTLHTDVAVKLIRPERAASMPALLARFEREAMATARITHPNVVKVMDYGTTSGVPYLVMELLRGFSLADLLERGGRLSFATARSLVTQIGSALHSAHEQGVVHRDIKPHNVYLTEGSQGYPLFVKVLDFGVAKMVGDETADPSLALTETGVVIGSAPYMSPEQLEGRRDVDLRTDLWSLAVITYECLTGERPFHGTSFVSVGAAVLKGRYRPISELRANLPPSIDDWFAKALSVDPDGRFQSAAALVEAFHALSLPQGEDISSTRPERPSAEALLDRRSADAYASTLDAAHPQGESGSTESHAPAEAGAPTQDHPSAALSAETLEPTASSQLPAIKPFAPLETARSEPPPATAIAPKKARKARLWGVAIALGAALPLALTAKVMAPRLFAPTEQRGCPAGMKLIAGTTFPMGSPEGGETPSDETPVHNVQVGAFCLDTTEVTVREYKKCTSCQEPAMTVEIEGLTPNARAFWSQFCNKANEAEHPQNCVDWYEAKAYCTAAGKRLPTEAEWELAARGTLARNYPWGPSPPDGHRLNACGAECSRMLTERFEKAGKGPWPAMHIDDDSAPSTAPAGRYPEGASPDGILDLAGNVWEWTESFYCPYSKKECEDSRRVLRGGGWDTVDSQFVRAAHRRPSAPSARGWSIGFRCALTP